MIKNILFVVIIVIIFGLVVIVQVGYINYVLDVKFNGDNMVGFMGDSDGKGYVYVFGIDGDFIILCYVV